MKMVLVNDECFGDYVQTFVDLRWKLLVAIGELLCSFIGCPADACEEVKSIANYVSTINGGHGAARDVIEHYLKEQGVWCEVVHKCFGDVGI